MKRRSLFFTLGVSLVALLLPRISKPSGPVPRSPAPPGFSEPFYPCEVCGANPTVYLGDMNLVSIRHSFCQRHCGLSQSFARRRKGDSSLRMTNG